LVAEEAVRLILINLHIMVALEVLVVGERLSPTLALVAQVHQDKGTPGETVLTTQAAVAVVLVPLVKQVMSEEANSVVTAG
jgi:hypothetical protein